MEKILRGLKFIYFVKEFLQVAFVALMSKDLRIIPYPEKRIPR